MNRIAIIAALLLSASALAVVALRPTPAVDRTPPAMASAASGERLSRGLGDEAEDGEARTVALERTVASLARRVAALESGRAAAGTRPGGAIPADDLAALRSDVDALLTGAPLETEAGQKRFKQLVRNAQDELFAERMQEHEQERNQERAERLTRLAEEAHLSAQQTQDLGRLLDDERDQRRALRDQGRTEGQRRSELFAEFQAVEQRTDDGARKLLDDEQYARYQEMRQQERPPWGGPGGPRGRSSGRGTGQR